MQVEELKRRLDAGDDLFVLDVREPHEYQICNIGGHLIPLGDLPKRVNELDSSREIVAHCRSGVRSAKAVGFLQQAGFKKVHNLAGGILAWADRVELEIREVVAQEAGRVLNRFLVLSLLDFGRHYGAPLYFA